MEKGIYHVAFEVGNIDAPVLSPLICFQDWNNSSSILYMLDFTLSSLSTLQIHTIVHEKTHADHEIGRTDHSFFTVGNMSDLTNSIHSLFDRGK